MVAKPLVVAASLTLFVAAGCGSSGAFSSVPAQLRAPSGLRPAAGHPVSQYIKNVIVIVQENRSFENLFAGFPGANAPTFGCVAGHAPAAFRAHAGSSSGCPSGDTQVPLHPITFVGPDLRHDWFSSTHSWNKGRMDGFWQFGQNRGVYDAYAYVSPDMIVPYMTLANTYVLADEMFPTEFGGSFTSHLTLVAGTDDISNHPVRAEVNFPTAPPGDCDSPPGTTSSYINLNRGKRDNGPFPCFDQFNTLAEVIDKAKVSWKYYVTTHHGAGNWSPFEAIKYVRYNRDWHRNVISPQTKILTDPGSNNLASVSWVTPSKPDSDHPGDKSDLGPSWVANVVNSIGESPYWNNSAIILLWDDWGGWYDNAAPPQLDFRGLGIRVPCLIISPYSRETSPSHPGYVSHTQYEFGSILRFIEEAFNLPYIGPMNQYYTDERATPLDDSFDFTQAPRPFVPLTPKYPRSRFLHEPPSNEPVDTQ